LYGVIDKPKLYIPDIDYETASDETLESLGEYFEELFDSDSRMLNADVSLASGVLNVTIPNHGTYVINKQSPNKQIWLSSPQSGPARFDLVIFACSNCAPFLELGSGATTWGGGRGFEGGWTLFLCGFRSTSNFSELNPRCFQLAIRPFDYRTQKVWLSNVSAIQILTV
jgi:frataxin